MSDGTGLAEALLGLDGFRVIELTETDAEVTIRIESCSEVVGCTRCGVRARSQDRMTVEYRDLAVFGRPARLVWVKRRWRCGEAECDASTWTETTSVLAAVLVDEPGRGRGVPPGRRECSAGVPARR